MLLVTQDIMKPCNGNRGMGQFISISIQIIAILYMILTIYYVKIKGEFYAREDISYIIYELLPAYLIWCHISHGFQHLLGMQTHDLSFWLPLRYTQNMKPIDKKVSFIGNNISNYEIK